MKGKNPKILIEAARQPGQERIEMVEYKGVGHPDTICDNVCEASSKALSQHYYKRFGHVLHHNIDKGLLVAGKANPRFKAGKILQPTKIIIAGRATAKMGKKKIPVNDIVVKTCKAYLKKFGLAKFQIKTEIKEGATNLTSITKKRVANDTSFGAAYYPYSKLDGVVLKVDKFIQVKKMILLK